MSDLIDRQATLDALTTEYMAVGILGDQRAISQCIDAIKILPSAQLEIIRCKDCIHWKGCIMGRHCEVLTGSVKKMTFVVLRKERMKNND